MKIDQLETPVPVIDLDRVEHNLVKMQAYCDLHGLKLRPHIKTHKLPVFAQRQMALGATGITCQKLGEAEVMADAGLNDIFLSYPLIGPAKASRLAALARRVTMRVAVDNPVALDTAARAAREAGAEIGVLVEFDSGGKRTGVVTVDEALELAQAIVAAAKQRLGGAGIEIRTVSGGGTPNAWSQHEIEGLTELRVGTYIYHDRATVGVGAATLDECALHLHATVVSRPTETRAVIDAGSKSLSSDRVAPSVGDGFGLILEYPDAIIERLNEEHGILDLSHSARKPAIGERVRIVPNHVCVVTNLHDAVVTSRNGLVEATLPVAARGRTR